MYIVPLLLSHILWLYWERNDSELVLWPVEWRLISGRAFAQFLRLIGVLAVRIEKPYLLTYTSAKYVTFIFLREKKYFAQGVYRGETRKRAFFSWADLYVKYIFP